MFDLTPSVKALWWKSFQNAWFAACSGLVAYGVSALTSAVAHLVLQCKQDDSIQSSGIKLASFATGAYAGFYIGMKYLPPHSFTFVETNELFFATLPIAAIVLIASAILKIPYPWFARH